MKRRTPQWTSFTFHSGQCSRKLHQFWQKHERKDKCGSPGLLSTLVNSGVEVVTSCILLLIGIGMFADKASFSMKSDGGNVLRC